jgi:hypothetical protein
VAAVAVGLAALPPAASMAAPAAKPKKCTAGKITVVTGKKRTCMTRGQLSRGISSGASLGEAIASLTFAKGLWRGGGRKAAADVLGKVAGSFRSFDVALVGASEHAGKPLLPDSPSGFAKGSGGGEENLGLDISQTPYGWSVERAEQTRKWVEEANGIQIQTRQTEGSMYETLKKQHNYDFIFPEVFKGDPCPKPGKTKGEATVDGTLTLEVKRTVEGFLSNTVVNVATVRLDFHGYVAKDGKLKSYDVAARVEASDGSWRGTAGARGLKPRAGPTAPSAIYTITAGAVSSRIDTATVARIVSQAVERGRTEVDRWLTASEGIWFTKAECKKADGDNLKKMKTGETRTINIDVRNIRNARADEEIQLKGQNGLEIVSPTGKVTAKDGKVSVQVRGTKGHLKTLSALAQPYVLEVDSLSELGRGATALEIPRGGDFQFKGRLRENDFVQFGHPSGQVEVDFHNCGDPLTDPWTGQATEVSEGDLLTFSSTWTLGQGTFSSPVDGYGYSIFWLLGSVDLEADPPVAHFQLHAFDNSLLTPTLELTDYDGCPP